MPSVSSRATFSLIVVSILVLGTFYYFFQQELKSSPPSSTVVVLDASAPMLEVEDSNIERIGSAKSAVSELIYLTPNKTKLGLVTYGSGTGNSEAEKEAGCKDISVIARPGGKSKESLRRELMSIVPGGYSPIGNALHKAATLLPKEGARTIVLIASGSNFCSPPLCEVAEELGGQGSGPVVHAVGFKADAKTKAGLKCLAEATGGIYAEASSEATLIEALATTVNDISVKYQLPSTQIELSPNKFKAPVLHVGTVDKPARYHMLRPASEGTDDAIEAHFKLDVPENHTLHIAMRAFPSGVDPRNSTYFNVELNSQSCPEATISADNPSSTGYGIIHGCTGEQHFTLSFSGAPVRDLDFTAVAVPKLALAEDNFNSVPSTPISEEHLLQSAPNRYPKVVFPATQPDESAPLITRTVEAQIIEGETQFFAVPIEWGQTLNLTAEVVGIPWGEPGRTFKFKFTNAIHEEVSSISSGYLNTTDVDKSVVIGTQFPISYANAIEGAPFSSNTSWLGGIHYVQVSLEGQSLSENDTYRGVMTKLAPITYRLTATPIGQAVQGPTFPKSADPASQDSSTYSDIGDFLDAAQEIEDSHWLFPVGIIVLIIAVLAAVGYALQRK